MPLARGGSNDLENQQLLCYYCNNLKSDKSHEYLIKRLREEGFCLDWADRLRRFGARAVFAGFSFVVTAVDAGAAVTVFSSRTTGVKSPVAKVTAKSL